MELSDRSFVPFRTIRKGYDFMYEGVKWRRIKGHFALPVSQIGTGHVGWPFPLDRAVAPCEDRRD